MPEMTRLAVVSEIVVRKITPKKWLAVILGYALYMPKCTPTANITHYNQPINIQL